MPACLALLLSFLPSPVLAESGLVFIVNRDNPVGSITREDLIDYYEKRKRLWPDGSPVRFIDRETGSSERARFLKECLMKTESDVDLFWFGQKLHSGDAMPIQIRSESL